VVGRHEPERSQSGATTQNASATELNASAYLLAAGEDTDVAVIDESRSYTYRDLRRGVGRLATALLDLELAPGSRIGIMGANSFFWIVAYLSAMRTGHIAVPFALPFVPEEVHRNAAWVGCAAMLVDQRVSHQLEGHLPDGVVVITEGILHSGTAELPRSAPTSPDSDAVLMFTSGTTSRPKAVRVTHRNIRANTESIIEYLDLRRSDRMLVVLPFHYCFGASLLHTHLRVGGSIVLCNTFTFPETAVDMMEAERCTGFAGVPSSIQLLLRLSTFKSRPLPQLRLIQQAGGKLPAPQIEELVAARPDTQVFIMYGQTEATARLSYLPPEMIVAKPGSIGTGIPGTRLQVLDDNDVPVKPGQVGEIVAFGQNISPGYYQDPEATAAKFHGGALRTGDLATVDEDRFIYIVDRKDDFIKSWGYRVSSQEIESCALELPELVSAAAIGVPNEAAGEAILLFVTAATRDGITSDDVLGHLRDRLARHMVPAEVRIVGALPLNTAGKVAKNQLRAEALSGGVAP
jgi:acyl-CoA synthetase (AMP-forming)/AMP-acid ligase II